jgi:hypothetical protein
LIITVPVGVVPLSLTTLAMNVTCFLDFDGFDAIFVIVGAGTAVSSIGFVGSVQFSNAALSPPGEWSEVVGNACKATAADAGWVTSLASMDICFLRYFALSAGPLRGRFETQIRRSQRSEADALSEAVRIWDLRFVAALYQAL